MTGFCGVNFTYLSPVDAGVNSIFLAQLTPINDATVTAVWLNITTSSTVNFKILIYDGSHSALLAQSATVTSLAAGANRIALASPLSVTGSTVYYVGYVCDSSLNVGMSAAASASWYAFGGQSVSSPANPLSAGSSNGYAPLIAMEFSGSQPYGWGPDYTANVTLDSTTIFSHCGGFAHAAARSATTQVATTPTKSYAEVTIGADSLIEANGSIGLLAACMGMATATSNQLYAEVYSFQYAEIFGTTPNYSVAPMYPGDTLAIAYDSGAQLVWFALNGGAWVGTGAGGDDPATSTAGLPVNPGNWPVNIFAGVGLSDGFPATFILRDAANLQLYAMPSGYSAWSGIAPVAFVEGVAGTAVVGDISFGIVPALAMGVMGVGYFPVRGIALFDGGSSGTNASVTGVAGAGAGAPLLEIDPPITGTGASGQASVPLIEIDAPTTSAGASGQAGAINFFKPRPRAMVMSY